VDRVDSLVDEVRDELTGRGRDLSGRHGDAQAPRPSRGRPRAQEHWITRIDAHQHLWDLAWGRYDWPTAADGPIHRTFTAQELAPELEQASIGPTVMVQVTDSLADTDAMLEVASQRPWVAGVVGSLPLADRAAAERELEVRSGRLCGMRHLIHREPDRIPTTSRTCPS
jgi:predicted TIM-barrel fold metal-dependent hydrolase